MKPQKKIKPRPSKTGHLVGVRLQDDELRALDEYRKKQSDTPTRPEALRRKAGLR